MKIAGIILLIVGIIGLAYFGYEAMQQSESFKIFGAEVAVTTANWTPVIVSGAIALVGLVMAVANKGSKT
jgi:NO-binding membrane sensor protein with MHYT domain